MSQNNSNTTQEAKENFNIHVDVHEAFDPILETKFISSSEFCKNVSDLFKAAFADFEGTTYEINQQGQGHICLFFNHSEPNDDTRVNGVTRTMPDKGGNLKNDTVRKIRANDSRNRNGDRYFLTDDASSALTAFVFDNIISKKDGKVQWDKITAEVAQQQQYFGQQPVTYTKVSLIDPVKLAAEIYGQTDEDGNNLVYAVDVLRSVPQMVNAGSFQAQWMLAIKKVAEKEVVKLCNQMGITVAQGLGIIR